MQPASLGRRPRPRGARHCPAAGNLIISAATDGVGCARATRPQGGQEMTEAYASATERTLENQQIGSLQVRVAILCGLVQMCDGYDLNAIAWAVPSLIKAWQLPPPAFTVTFLWSSIGIMVG